MERREDLSFWYVVCEWILLRLCIERCLIIEAFSIGWIINVNDEKHVCETILIYGRNSSLIIWSFSPLFWEFKIIVSDFFNHWWVNSGFCCIWTIKLTSAGQRLKWIDKIVSTHDFWDWFACTDELVFVYWLKWICQSLSCFFNSQALASIAWMKREHLEFKLNFSQFFHQI